METSTAVATSPSLKLVQQAYTDFANGNIAGIIDACADDVAFGTYSNPYIHPSGYFYGKEGAIEFFKQVEANYNITLFEPQEFITQGDRVMVLGRQTATVKQTGKTIDHKWCMSFTVLNGKIKDFFEFGDSYLIAQAFQ